MVNDRDFRELLSQDVPIPQEVEIKTQQAYRMIREGKCKIKRRSRHVSLWKPICAVAVASVLLVTGVCIGTSLSHDTLWLSDIIALFSGNGLTASSKDPLNYDIHTSPDEFKINQTYNDGNVELTVDKITCDGIIIEITTTLKINNKPEEPNGFYSDSASVSSHGAGSIKSHSVKVNGNYIVPIGTPIYTLSGENTYTCTTQYNLGLYRYTTTQGMGEEAHTIPDEKALTDPLQISIYYPGFTSVDSFSGETGAYNAVITNCVFNAQLTNFNDGLIEYQFEDSKGTCQDEQMMNFTRMSTTDQTTWLGFAVPAEQEDVKVALTTAGGEEIPLEQKNEIFNYVYNDSNYQMIGFDHIPKNLQYQPVVVHLLADDVEIGAFTAVPSTPQ